MSRSKKTTEKKGRNMSNHDNSTTHRSKDEIRENVVPKPEKDTRKFSERCKLLPATTVEVMNIRNLLTEYLEAQGE